ncbi:TolC family protein [bacterium]|nr:TolC family protein [bacterium]
MVGCRSADVSRPQAALAPASPTNITVAASLSAPAIETKEVELVSGIENEESIMTLAATRLDPIEPPPQPVSLLNQPVRESNFNLMDSISTGLAQNPDLVALRRSEGVGIGVLGVAETYPYNPFVQVRATPYQDAPAAGQGTMYHYVLLMQRIELAHQRQFREQNAASSLNQIRWSIHSAELQNVGQSARFYFTALYQRDLLQLAEENHQNNLVLKDTLKKQLEAGQASEADYEIVRIDTQSTAQQLRLAKASYETSLRDLKRQLGLSPETDLMLADRLTDLQWKMPTLVADGGDQPCKMNDPEMISHWAASRPDVLAALANVDAARANLGLASAAKIPDIQVGPYYQRSRDQSTYLGFQLQMDIPVLNTGRPLERQRIYELNQQTVVWRQLFRRANLEAEAAWQRYRIAYDNLKVSGLDQPIKTPEALEGLDRQFRAGEVDITRVVQARNSIIQNQRTRLDLYNELSQAAADVITSVGLPVEDVVQ